VVEAAATALCNLAAESAGRVAETVGRGDGGGGGGGAPLAAAAAIAIERAACRGFPAAGAEAGAQAAERTEPHAWWAALQQTLVLLRRLAEVGGGAGCASGDAA
jgi:hypothetical protein